MITLLGGNDTGAVAFAPHMIQLESSAATTPHADVFVRRERQAAVLSRDVIPKTERIRFKDLPDVLITYPDTGGGLPPWVVPVLRSLAERRGIEPGWDSYDAQPTESRHINRLMSYLFAVMASNSTPPLITPLSDGGVQATWHRNSKDLEVVVSADEPPIYYFHDAATGEEKEEEVEPNLGSVRTLIHQF